MTDCKNGCDLQGNRSHDVGGIDTIVENINKNIEVESQEIIICKKALEDNNVYTYEGSHKQILNKMNKRYGKPLKVITNKDNVITVETGQVVINKRAVNSNVKKRYTGTNREILDKINTSTGGKSIMKHGGFVDSVLQNGGMILNGETKLQSLLLSKSNFKNKHEADNWVLTHGFISEVSDETDKYYRYRVNDPKDFKKLSFRTIILKNSGVKAVVGIYKDANDKGSNITEKSIKNQIKIREKQIEHELKINKGVLDDRIKLQKAIDSDKKLKELKGMLVEKMGKGGSVEPLFDLDFYQVTQSSERDSDYLYQGIDFDDAKSEYDYASEQDEDTYVILEKYTNKYKFVYELDAENEETIEDYPIEDYYNDSDYHKLVENGLDNGTEILESKKLERLKSNKENIEEGFLQLHSDFIESFEDNYKNKIHLQEYAGLMGRSKYYYLLLDANSDLIDFDKDNILLYLEKKDSTFDDRIVRNFVNVNKENAVLCVRISDHNKVYKTYGDACLSIVFDKKSDRIELQDTDGENENIVELTYGIEKYFENYSISEIFDVEYSVDSFIKDLDYNSLIDGRESEEYKKGGEIQPKTEENKKQFMMDFINWYKKDVHEKMNIFVSINKSKDCVYIDMFEKIDQNVDAKPYLQYICDLADKYNVNIRLEPVPRYKFFLKNTEKRKKITKDYLIEYYKKFGFMEEGSEMIREYKNTPFNQLCNVFKSEMEHDYGFKFIENTDNFNSKYGNGHVEFTMEKDDKYATAFIYFEGKRGFPIIFGFDEKGNYYADYSTFETILKLIKRKEFKEGGTIQKSRMEDFINAFYRDIEQNYNIEIKKQYDTFSMFGQYGHFEFLIPSDKMEGEILMYFKVLANRNMTDFMSTKGDVIVTPVIKCYIDKDYNITFDYSELDKYLQQYGVEKFKDGGEVVNDKYYALSFGNYIQVKFVENLSIQGLDLFLYKDDGYFGIADEKTGIRIGGGAIEKDRAIDNADNFIQNHGKEKVIEYLKNAQLSPRYSKETKTFEESQFDKIKDLYESKDFKKLYEIISNNANTTSRKALSQILERSIVNYNNSQINDLFLEFGYDIRKINLENERIKKQKDAELKQAEIDKQNEYKKTEYPYLDLSNMSPKQFAILDKAMQKQFRYDIGVMSISKYIKTIKDDIIGITSSTSEYGRNGELRAAPLTEYFYQTKDKFLHSIPKLAYDNWIGFKNENELKEYLQGGISDGKTTFDIANKHDADESYVEEQIDKGIKIEREHTDNDIIAEEIARDHLWEHIDYYEELEKMEEKLKNIKRASKYSNEELTELCKQADINKETLVFDVPDDKIEYYKSLGFVIKNE